MVKFNVDEMLTYHEYWKENLSEEEANKLIALSKLLCHKVVDNDGYITGISLSYPDDCNDLIILASFTNLINHPSRLDTHDLGKTIVTFH